MEFQEIKSVADVFEILKFDSPYLAELELDTIRNYKKLFPYGMWFRGQAKAKLELVPTVFRKNDSGEFIYAKNEDLLIQRFMLKQVKYRAQLKTTFDWLSLAQHHGYPTRFLDWSENILVALYFAVAEEPQTQDEPGSLFILNSFKLNSLAMGGVTHLFPDDFPCWIRAQMSLDTSFNEIRHQIINERPADLCVFEETIQNCQNNPDTFKKVLIYPLAIFPHHHHERMALQQSTFVLHGGTCVEPNSFEAPILLEKLNSSSCTHSKFMKKLLIAPENKPNIRRQLQTIGIHIGSLFPELDYQSQHLKDLWELKTGS